MHLRINMWTEVKISIVDKDIFRISYINKVTRMHIIYIFNIYTCAYCPRISFTYESNAFLKNHSLISKTFFNTNRK